MSEQFITYFGYGSLVNRETRPAAEQAFPARLYGWRRVWGHRVQASDDYQSGTRGSCCSLSVERCTHYTDTINPDIIAPGKTDHAAGNPYTDDREFIDGVVVTIPLTELPVLDQREAGYDRVQVPASDFDLPKNCAAKHIHLYVSSVTHSGRSNIKYPILQSYVDCVLAGYCAVFKQAGMQQFVESTAGWDGVIENERNNPRYPRAVELPASQLALFDSIVNNHRNAK